MKKPMIRSSFPLRPLPFSFLVTGGLTAASIVAAVFGALCWAIVPGVLALFLVVVEIDTRLHRVCPHCGQQSLRIVGTGGIWDEDFREERVYWGECSACGKLAMRRGSVFVAWTAYPGADESAASKACM